MRHFKSLIFDSLSIAESLITTLSTTDGETPEFNRRSTNSVLSVFAAKWRGVRPTLSTTDGEIPDFNRRSTDSVLSVSAAKWRGVRPLCCQSLLQSDASFYSRNRKCKDLWHCENKNLMETINSLNRLICYKEWRKYQTCGVNYLIK